VRRWRRGGVVCAFILLGCLARLRRRNLSCQGRSPRARIRRTTSILWRRSRSQSNPYDVEDKASIFSVNYRNNGYMPVFFVITNDGDQPVSLVDMKAQLNTKDRSKLYPASMDDLLRRLSIQREMTGRIRLPIPLPKRVQGGVSRKTWARSRRRILPVISRWMRQPPQQVVHGSGVELAAIFGIQLRLHVTRETG